VGYRVYRGATLICPTGATTLDLALSCLDANPPAPATGIVYTVRALYRDAAGTILQSAGTDVSIATTPQYQDRLLSSTSTGGASGTGCYAGSAKHDLVSSLAGSTATSYNFRNGSTAVLSFCTASVSSALTLSSPITGSLRLRNTNSPGPGGGGGCDVRLRVMANGNWASPLGTGSVWVTNGANALLSFSVPIATTTLNGTDKFGLAVWTDTTSNPSCNNTWIDYGGAAPNTGTVSLSTGQTWPSGPAAPTIAADPSATIAWSQPSGTPAPLFYRVYRDGKNVADRVDTAGADSASVSWADDGPSAGHTYYVTAVSSTMTESAFSNGVAG